MKKFFKIISITISILFLLLALLVAMPFIFKDKIIEFAKIELNKMLTAEVDFGELKLSFIRNFPDAYVGLEDLTVIGKGDFEGDTGMSIETALAELQSSGITQEYMLDFLARCDTGVVHNIGRNFYIHP